jgi:hypothetical protein
MCFSILRIIAQVMAPEPVGSDWIWVLAWVFGMALIVVGSWAATLGSSGAGPWRDG